MSSRLPDAGKKLDDSIVRIRQLLSIKENLNTTETISASAVPHPAVNKVVEPPKLETQLEDEDSHDIIDALDSLSLGSGDESSQLEDLTQIEQLTLEEVEHARRICNLPQKIPPPKERTSLHPFIFRLRPLPQPFDGLVCLTAVDCQ